LTETEAEAVRTKKTRKSRTVKMSRRSFLKSGASAGIFSLALPGLAYGERQESRPSDSARATTGIAPFELEETSILELQAGLQSGKFTARSLAQQYLARIDEIDKRGPAINAILQTNPDALSIADRCDAERKSGKLRGPLHGIPILIKDNIGTADGMMTTAGSLALLGFTPNRDSGVARRLRESGAVILGKANLSEWANFRSSHSSSGWSGRGGQTRNPYALDRNPSGSSSGSAVAAAASLCAGALGTETNGSIVSPSSSNGLVGIKPTVGLVSRTGIVPISHSQDTAGPICRTVSDAVTLLSAIAGTDIQDPATQASRGKSSADYSRFLDPKGLRGVRIGVVRKLFGATEATDALIETALDAMKHEGATVVDPVEIESLGKFDDSEMEVLLYEFKADLNAYLAGFAPNIPMRSLQEIIEFNERNRDKELPYFGQDIMLKSEEKGQLTEKAYQAALERSHDLTRQSGIDAVMDKHKLDALVAPTRPPAGLTDLVDGDHRLGGSAGLPAVAGYPHITVPAGFVFGLPVGISFFGRAWSEPALIRIAYGFEQATRARKPPRFLATAQLEPIV
jgi:amidase